jgi:hypothetical protein
MNRIFKLSWTATLLLSACTLLAQSAQQQPLGDYARRVKNSKSTPASADQKKVYDNDNLPTSGTVSVVGASAASNDPVATDRAATDDSSAQPGSSEKKKTEKKDAKDDTPQIKPGQSIQERQQAVDAWKKKIDAQNEKITSLSHELDLLQREYRVKASEFYSNTAMRTQNPTAFAKDDADYKKQIADKQQAVDAAKSKLSDMQEEARRAGVPSSGDQN